MSRPDVYSLLNNFSYNHYPTGGPDPGRPEDIEGGGEAGQHYKPHDQTDRGVPLPAKLWQASFVRRFYTLYVKKYSNLRTLLSICFPQVFEKFK